MLSCLEQSRNIEQDVSPDWWNFFELRFEEEALIFFDCDDSSKIGLLTIKLECIWDWLDKVDDDGEDELLYWLTVKTLLSECDICMVLLCFSEHLIENEILLDCWRVFELRIKDETLLGFDCDECLIDGELCLL